MKDFWVEENENKIKESKLNKKKLISIILIIIVIILTITIVSVYNSNAEAREWINVNILRKQILQEDVNIIEITEVPSQNVFAFNSNICIVNKNKLDVYNQLGGLENSVDMEISNPIFATANRFLAVAESEGQRVYVTDGKNILWQTSIEGNISQIHINKNGYTAIVITETTHKTVVQVHDNEGNELFKQFLSNTRITDVDISNDNQFLAMAEIDTASTILKSDIKILSIEKAATGTMENGESVLDLETDELLIDLEYTTNNELICMYTDSVRKVSGDTNEIIKDFLDRKVTYQTIFVQDTVVYIEEKSSGLFTADSYIYLYDVKDSKEKEYIIEEVANDLVVSNDIIAVNLGTEIEFINSSGGLVKRYLSSKEITNITFSRNIAAVVYTDKIEIINL